VPLDSVDVLIPTSGRPVPLAMLLAGLAVQTHPGLRIVVSDQTPEHEDDPFALPELRSVVRVLEARGHDVELHRHLPRRGMAEHRQSLLDRAGAPYALFLDDDIIVEPDLVERLLVTIREERCGFVGCGLIGASYANDERPDEQVLELWDGRVEPEVVEPMTPAWERYRLHNAANVLHAARRLGLRGGERVRYRVAWIGGCVMYDVAALREAAGFAFWRELPVDHAGEDVLAQLRVMARRGGCGILPSGAYHQELSTTVDRRRVDAPCALPVHDGHAAA
jgi:hypothetical protein